MLRYLKKFTKIYVASKIPSLSFEATMEYIAFLSNTSLLFLTWIHQTSLNRSHESLQRNIEFSLPKISGYLHVNACIHRQLADKVISGPSPLMGSAHMDKSTYPDIHESSLLLYCLTSLLDIHSLRCAQDRRLIMEMSRSTKDTTWPFYIIKKANYFNW